MNPVFNNGQLQNLHIESQNGYSIKSVSIQGIGNKQIQKVEEYYGMVKKAHEVLNTEYSIQLIVIIASDVGRN